MIKITVHLKKGPSFPVGAKVLEEMRAERERDFVHSNKGVFQ
jgi:hypothetical protein